MTEHLDPSKNGVYRKYLEALKDTNPHIVNSMHVRDVLTKHMKYKKQLDPKYKNYMQYSIEELEQALNSIVPEEECTRIQEWREGKVTIKAYGKDDHEIYKKLYAETNWCTTSNDTFNDYTMDDPLYVIEYNGSKY